MTNSQVPDFDTVTSPPRRSDISYETVKDGEVIGSGGQAIVKRVSLPGPDPPDTVAVKQPQAPSETVDTAVIESFFQEAETWATLAQRERTEQHRDTDHIVGIVATGEDLPWLAMEYMDGGNLADRLDSYPNGLPVDEALWIADCLCKGLKLAHDNGVAHLDLKPANILFRETPGDTWDVPKIADWGLARSLLADSQSMDMLSVEYAAPEQSNPDEFGKPDKYTDIYQLGVIIYEMLTAELPHTGEQPEIMHGVIYEDEPDPPSSKRESIPQKLDNAILKVLSRDKQQRYQGSIDRLVDVINDICQSNFDNKITFTDNCNKNTSRETLSSAISKKTVIKESSNKISNNASLNPKGKATETPDDNTKSWEDYISSDDDTSSGSEEEATETSDDNTKSWEDYISSDDDTSSGSEEEATETPDDNTKSWEDYI